MMKLKSSLLCILAVTAVYLSSCGSDEPKKPPVKEPDPKADSIYFGADLSYVNQILDHGGVYKDKGEVKSPYKIFKDRGNAIVRLRLWHNPTWTKTVYSPAGSQMYNDIKDVEKSIKLSKEQGMAVLLDFHYSDTWADPEKQEIPAAWMAIKDLAVLKDSVYNYTLKTLQYLDGKGLMPEFVQVGNENNCGLFYYKAPAKPPTGFPNCNVCEGQWPQFGGVVNSAISAVRKVSSTSSVKTKIALHVADPKNVEWWFDDLGAKGLVTDYDIIGFSYYPLWHTTVPLAQLSTNIAKFKNKYGKDIMILETAYPWTKEFKDSYSNLFGSQTELSGFPFTNQGQFDLMTTMTQAVVTGGGKGIIYWEPAWITSNMKDLYGTGSSYENSTLFDFDGNTNKGMEYMKVQYTK